ncbi:MAG: S41 family peptidase [Lentisphaeria bacterium]|nr:S41 family peptidase [Lentisphaeria bacterium]
MRKVKLSLSILTAVLAVNLLIGYRVFSKEAEKTGASQVFEHIDTLMRVLQLIRTKYVDIDKVTYKDLVYGALEGMTARLDPYSAFLPPDDLESLMEDTEGEFGGIGITVSMKDGKLIVVAPIDDTPGARAGIRPGDQITSIDGEPILRMNMEDAVKLMRGRPGTKVKLTLSRPGTPGAIDLELERAIIPLQSVVDATVLPETNIGFVRLTQFMEPTAAGLEKALRDFAAKDVDALIIDLRRNPGGLLGSAVDVCSFFLPPNELVVSVEGRDEKKEERSGGGYKFPREKPLLLLIDGGSASASEIVAGCLRDSKRAVLVGEKTFGKGRVQNVIELEDGSALKLTVAMYYTPSRRVIDEHGIEPDIVEPLTREDMAAMARSELNVDPAADPQLRRAIEVLTSYNILRAKK